MNRMAMCENTHRDPIACAQVKVPPFLLATFQGQANTQAGLIFVFFSVSVFTTGLVTDIYLATRVVR